MIRNLLSKETAGTAVPRVGSVGNWVSLQNASLSYSSRRYKVGSASFLLTHTGTVGSTAIIASGSPSKRTRVSESVLYRAAVWFHHNRRLRPVRIGIEFFDISGVSLTYNSRIVAMTCARTANVRLDDWTLGIVEATSPIDAHSAVLRIELPNLALDVDDGLLWIDSASLVEYEEPSTITVRRMMAFMPEYMDESDRAQTSPTRPLARFADLTATQLEEIRLLNFAFDYRSIADGGEPDDTSILIDPSGYPTSGVKQEWLPWIAQHLGVPPAELEGSSTPWFYLESQYPTWSTWETEINENPADPPYSIINAERSTGISQIQTSAPHDLAVGDVVTVATTPASAFDGIYSVLSISSTDIFAYSQQYKILSGVRSVGSNEVTLIGSRPHGLTVGASVSVSGTGDASIEGIQIVTGVFQGYDDGGFNSITYNTASTAAATVFSGVFYPVDFSSSPLSGSATKSSDLTWVFLEGDNPSPVTTDIATAELVRSGATGIWGGTIEGMKRSVRVVLDASEIVDLRAVLSCRDGLMTVTCREAHNLSVGDFVEVYRSSEVFLNGVYSVFSVVSPEIFTVVCRQGFFVSDGWITSKKVEIEKGKWNGSIVSVAVSSGVMTITLRDSYPEFRDPESLFSPNFLISGTGNSNLDTTHAGPLSLSGGRKVLTCSTSLDDFTATALPSSAKILLDANQFCFLIKTLSFQTLSVDQAIAFAAQAKPAGAVVTHQFLP
jgi:hypothetical protein